MRHIKKYFFLILALMIIMINPFMVNAASFQYSWKGPDVNDVFLTKVLAISTEIGANPDDLMAVMAFESGLNHTTVNPISGATGLIQFMPSTASGLGTSTTALKSMTAIQQLDYVKKYFLQYANRVSNIGDLYMAVLWPIGIGKADSFILFASGSQAYSQNSGLDGNGDGKVTKKEAYQPVINKMAHFIDGSSAPTPSTPTSFYYTSPGINPEGTLDIAEGGNGTFHIRGWAFDRNSNEPLMIHVYVGGSAESGKAIWSTGTVIANKNRSDVNNVYPGAGNNHGFDETFTVPFSGTYPVYVYAINVGGRGTSSNYNTLLSGAPKSITVEPKYAHLDVNASIDGKIISDLGDVAITDIWIDYGRVAQNVNDYYAAWPIGTHYRIDTPIVLNDNYMFDGVISGALEGEIGEGDTVVTLSFSTRSYKISFNLNGGSCDDDLMNNKYVKADGIYGALPIPKKEGYVFNGWYTGEIIGDGSTNGTEALYNTTFSGSNLYASWLLPGWSIGRPREYTKEYNGHEYHIFETSMSWTEAEQYCIQEGGHLVSINDTEELNAIKDMISGGRMGCYYIGATDAQNEGNWKWTSGEPFVFSNWGYYESHGGTNENYAAIIDTSNSGNYQSGEWIDIPNLYTGPDFYHYSNCGFICELDYIPISLSDSRVTKVLKRDTYPLGKVPQIDILVSYNGTELVRNQDYKLVYIGQAPLSIGTFYFRLEGMGKYTGISGTFTIYIVDPAEIKYKVIYDLNGGEGNIASQEKGVGESINISDLKPSREGYIFMGWAKTPLTKNVLYSGGESYSNDADLTLYAIWDTYFTIKYDLNGGTGKFEDQIVPQSKTAQAPLESPIPPKESLEFYGWVYTNAEGKSYAAYPGGYFYDVHEDCTVRAQYLGKSYTIKYDANGGEGEPSSQNKLYDYPVKLSAKHPKRSGYAFLGWATNSNATLGEYKAGEMYNNNSDVVLYAVWGVPVPDMVLPLNLELIEQESFAGGNFTYVQCSENTKAIRSRAFADCVNLRYIYIPEETSFIATDAFSGDEDLTIHGKEGSYAEFYADKNGYEFVPE